MRTWSVSAKQGICTTREVRSANVRWVQSSTLGLVVQPALFKYGSTTLNSSRFEFHLQLCSCLMGLVYINLEENMDLSLSLYRLAEIQSRILSVQSISATSELYREGGESALRREIYISYWENSLS